MVLRGTRELIGLAILLSACAEAPEPRPPAPAPRHVEPVAKTIAEEAAGEPPPILSGDPPFDPARLDALSRTGRLADAAHVLDRILGDPASGTTIVRAGGEDEPVWTSARELARRRLLASPEVREESARAHEAEAEERFDRAWRAGSADALVRLADRYPAAPGAARALDRAASLYFESGALLAACHAWSRALEVAASGERAALAARAAMAHGLVPARSETAPGHPLALAWHRQGGAPRSCAGAEALFLHEATAISALEVATGRLVWRRTFPRVEPGPIAVAQETVVAIRGGKRVLVLGRASGSTLLEIELARDLKGAAKDTIDAAAWSDGLLVVAARLDGERVVAGFDLARAPIFVTSLWEGKGKQAALLVERDRVHVAADAAFAVLGRDGTVLLVRGLAAAAASSREDEPTDPRLERVGDELVFTGPVGAAVVSAETGLARSAHDVPGSAVVVGVRGAEPLLLAISDPMPEKGIQISADEGEEIPRTVTVSALRGGALRTLGSLWRRCFCVRPPFSGAVASGILWLHGDGRLRTIDLATWRITDEVVSHGTRRLELAGSVALVTGTESIDAFATAGPAPPRPLPLNTRELLARLDSPSWQEREQALERLELLGERVKADLVAAHEDPRSSAEVLLAAEKLLHLGPAGPEAPARPSLEEHFASLIDLAGSSSDLAALVHARSEGEEEARKFLAGKPRLAEELGAYFLDANPEDVRLAAAELLVMAGGAERGTPGNAVLTRGLRDERYSVRSPVYRALFEKGGIEGRDLAVSILPKPGVGKDDHAERELRKMLEPTGKDERADALKRLLLKRLGLDPGR